MNLFRSEHVQFSRTPFLKHSSSLTSLSPRYQIFNCVRSNIGLRFRSLTIGVELPFSCSDSNRNMMRASMMNKWETGTAVCLRSQLNQMFSARLYAVGLM
jgi:hypothetical protein